MLGTVLIVVLDFGACGGAAPMVAQPGLGLCPNRRDGPDHSHRCRSRASRPHLTLERAGGPRPCGLSTAPDFHIVFV